MKRTLLIIAGLAVVGAVLVASGQIHWRESFRKLFEWIESLGALGPVLFILVYVAACVLFIPGSPLTLGAGIVFGVLRGTVFVMIGATLGATAAFLTGRYLARNWVATRIAGNSRFKAIDDAVAREGWKIVGLMRLSPVLPFTLLNYAFGVTRVSLRDYFWASLIGMLPGTLMYVYAGSLLGDLGSLGRTHRSRTTAEWALYAAGLVATIAVTVFVTRLARKALSQKIAV
ncbi:MAG TPA: TVP38/TMEM64 family protein [Verrucomicrobiae bacterium]|nr:TVP38/TMEM64 family protein [Verrucomicrobiae bacterium]